MPRLGFPLPDWCFKTVDRLKCNPDLGIYLLLIEKVERRLLVIELVQSDLGPPQKRASCSAQNRNSRYEV
jgi:hypothetical protein